MENQVYILNPETNVFQLGILPLKTNTSSNLPAGFYKFKVDESMAGLQFSFVRTEPFTLVEESFGDLEEKATHITKARELSKGTLGVLLYGVSGTGKSLLAKTICNNLMAKNYPVIIVDAKYVAYLKTCIDNLKQPSVILLDEFEKMYETTEDQSELLTILDGVYQSEHTFILTANDLHRINQYMLDRPSRIKYAIEYDSLDINIVKDILNKKLEDKSKVDKVLSILMQVTTLSFDVLFQFINEVNTFPDVDVNTLANYFNISISDMPLSYTHKLSFVDNKGVSLSKKLLEITNKYNLKIKEVTFSSNNLNVQELFSLERGAIDTVRLHTEFLGEKHRVLGIPVSKFKDLIFGETIQGYPEFQWENRGMESALEDFFPDYEINPKFLEEVKSAFENIKVIFTPVNRSSFKFL